MKLKRPLPEGRSLEQLENHYRVEKSIAEKLKASSREERKVIYSTMYDELFEQVPDHPRLTRRTDDNLCRLLNKNKLSMVRKFLDESTVFGEIAPGDCRFSFEVARHVKQVYGIDISDQRNPDDPEPDNFSLILFDGYTLDQVESDSIDVSFSDQLIEHLHPEDTRLHFEMVHRILRKGGRYVFRTPHFLTGPHDVSQFFCDEPEGFHLKEWTYREIRRVIQAANYSGFEGYWSFKGKFYRFPFIYFAAWEMILGMLPKKISRFLAEYLLRTVCAAAVK